MSSKTQDNGYEIVPFARIREAIIDVMVPAQKKHNIHVLFEADVTDVRAHLRKIKAETATFDHDIVDGAPAARFAQALKELIENGYGLLD